MNSVREDPNREGLLYAGTNHGVYVTFDDGGWWQELNPGLPDVPVTITRTRDFPARCCGIPRDAHERPGRHDLRPNASGSTESKDPQATGASETDRGFPEDPQALAMTDRGANGEQES